MQIELRSGAVRLGPNQTLKVLDGAGSTICARGAAVWITEENRPQDIVVEPGGCYRLANRGVAIIEALGSASVSFA